MFLKVCRSYPHMREQTTVALKALVIFLLLYVGFGIYQEFQTGFVLTSYDQLGIFVAFILAAFLLMFNVWAGYLLALLGMLWMLFSPLSSYYFTKGIFYALLSGASLEAMVHIIAWIFLALGVLILFILRLFHKRTLSVEIFFAIYIFTCAVALLGGLVDVFFAGSAWMLSVFLLPSVALLSYLILFLVGYFVERQ